VGLPLTPSQTVGPFFSYSLLDGFFGPELVDPSTPGALRIRGRIVDGTGEPVPDAMVELWQRDTRAFGRSGTDEDGGFEFVTVKPAAGGAQAPHLDVAVFARGLLKQLATRIYFPDEDEANEADQLLSALDREARATLIALREDDGTLRFDIRLQGDQQTTFFIT
jgi:protocatechuate 3,4-dioxygenase alpha subunit